MAKFKFHLLIYFIFIVALSSLNAALRCDHCGKPIKANYIVLEEKNYHSECYEKHIKARCTICGRTIDGYYNYDENGKYHPDCFRQNVLPRCVVCNDALEGTFLKDSFGNQFHPYHERINGTCSVCSRILCDASRGAYRIADREICGFCEAESVVKDAHIRERYRVVRYLLMREMGIDLPDDVPIVLISSRREMRKESESHGDLSGFTHYVEETLAGIVIRRELKIYILSHLPEIVFDAVLAHELLHVYLYEADLDPPPPVTEGFCNLGSELVYENSNKPLAEVRMESMQDDPDPDYGAGYRRMKKQLARYGWRELLRRLR